MRLKCSVRRPAAPKSVQPCSIACCHNLLWLKRREMTSEPRAMPGLFSGLSVKLIATITLVILAVEVVIYLPSAGNLRESWLHDRLRLGLGAARVLDAVPDAMNLPKMLTNNLLRSAGAIAIVYRRNGQSQLVELDEKPMPRHAVTVDMRQT